MRALYFLLFLNLALFLHTKPLFVAAAEEGEEEKAQTQTKMEELKHGDIKDSLREAVEELAALEELEAGANAGVEATLKNFAAGKEDDHMEGVEYDEDPIVNRECKGLGYVFCESLQRCVKSWKETCPSIDEAVAALREMEENFEGGDYQKEDWYINAILPPEDEQEEEDREEDREQYDFSKDHHAEEVHEFDLHDLDQLDHDQHHDLELEEENEMMET